MFESYVLTFEFDMTQKVALRLVFLTQYSLAFQRLPQCSHWHVRWRKVWSKSIFYGLNSKKQNVELYMAVLNEQFFKTAGQRRFNLGPEPAVVNWGYAHKLKWTPGG